jgi:phenylalanyl-tRNA synthetase beta chain
MIAELAGGTIEKGIVDIYPDKIRPAELPFRYDRARDIIGEDIPSEDMKGMLLRLGFEIKDESEHKLTVLAPTHRHDMEQEIDLVEEIARLYTYEEIEAKYETSISFGAMAMPDYLRMPTLTDQLRAYMVNNGFFEIITQNMIDPASAKIFTDAPVRIANPLGEELSIMRPSVVPSALRVIEKNFRLNNYNLRLFEIGRIFEKCDPREDTFIEGIREKQHFMAAMTGEGGPVQWAAGDREVDFYDIKGLAEDMIEFLMLTGIKIKPAKSNHPAFSKNSVELLLKKKSIGRLGEIRRDLLEKFDIENNVYMLLIDFDEMARVPVKEKKYSPVSPYPGISRDLAFVAPDKTPAGEVEDQIWQNGGKLLNNVRLFDVYSGKSIGSGMKSLAFNLYYSSPERTLVDKEVDKSVNKIVKAIEKKFDAKLREF